MSAVYRVYVVQNSAGKFHIGLSEDVEIRLSQHNCGESKWTKLKGPWRLAWNGDQMPLSEARRLENLLKRQKGGDGFFRITGLKRAGS